jgi:hypothetical protein
VAVASGEHQVVLRRDGSATVASRVRAEAGRPAHLLAELWLRRPQVHRLRPPYPGAVLADARFLADGRVVLAVELPPSGERQLWLADGRGAGQRIGPPLLHGAGAVAPGGDRLAYLAAGASGARGVATGPGSRLNEVWLTGTGGDQGQRLYALGGGTGDERLVDVSWAPDGRSLLLASERPGAGGGRRTILRRLDPRSGEAAELVGLPAAAVPGGTEWASGGDQLALLARTARQASLCLLDVTTGAFTYVADLPGSAPGGGVGSAPFPPAAWSPDGRSLILSVPGPGSARPTGWLPGLRRQLPPELVLVPSNPSRDSGGTRVLGAGEAPIWRPDGAVVAFARAGRGRPPVLRLVPAGPAGMPGSEETDIAELPDLPLPAGVAFGARWDPAHGQAVAAVAPSGGPPAGDGAGFWLVRCRPESDGGPAASGGRP